MGFRPHTGWTMAVAAAGVPPEPALLVRRRIDLVARWRGTEAAQVYHRAEHLPLGTARRKVDQAAAVARERALAGLDDLARDVAPATLAAVGVVTGSGRLPDSLEAILRSHPLIHSAEGALYCQAVAEAGRQRGLAVIAVAARELMEAVAAALDLREPEVAAALAEVGRAVGRPWGKDEKESTLVAWMALAGRPGQVRSAQGRGR